MIAVAHASGDHLADLSFVDQVSGILAGLGRCPLGPVLEHAAVAPRRVADLVGVEACFCRGPLGCESVGVLLASSAFSADGGSVRVPGGLKVGDIVELSFCLLATLEGLRLGFVVESLGSVEGDPVGSLVVPNVGD